MVKVMVLINFLSLTTIGLCQTKELRSTEPFKGANTIIFMSKISDDSLYTLVGRKLVSEGFSIDVNNREFMQMKTGPKESGSHDVRYSLTISVNKGEVTTRITMITEGILGVHDWVYNKSKATIYYDVQTRVLNLLSEFGQVYYAAK